MSGAPSASHDAWDPILAAAKAALPESGSITVTDRAGTITHSTQRLIIGQSRSDSFMFRRLAAGHVDELVLDRPFMTVVEPKQYVIPVGRPLTTTDGAFDGIVVATVLPETYRAFFKTLDVGTDGVISVLHPDGVVLFREPSTRNPINEGAADDPLLKLAQQAPKGAVHGPLGPGGPTFISAYRTVGHPPVVVAVSLSEDDVLEDWRRQRRVSAAAFGALTLTLGAMVIVLFKVVDARERAERELAAVQRLESEHLRDANERLEAALEREQRARQETEAASYLKDEFLMTVSHELRTPLTAIYGWARVLSTRQMEPGQQAQAIAAIERNAHAQTRLIDDLLDVGRAISGKLRLDARAINVADVLRAAVETVSPAMAAKRITFEAAFDPDTPPIVADPDRLQQIAWNLLSNAIKFTPEGGTVRLRLSRTDTQVEIAVSDTGSGIPADFLPYVFERFRQADAGSRRRYGGLGLGLAIVRHLVELHGGTVTAESGGEDQGATFRVRLPPRPARRRAERPHWRSRNGDRRLDGMRVLNVDSEGSRRRDRACSAAARRSSPRRSRSRAAGTRRRAATGRSGGRDRSPAPRPRGSTTGSSRNTYSAAVRFSPRPPAFRLIRNRPHRRIGLKPVHRRLPILRPPVEVLVDDAGLVEARAQQREQAGELREDQRLVPFLPHFGELRQQRVELRGRHVLVPRIDQPGMARRLAQAQQRLEHVHLRLLQPVARDAPEQRRPIVVPQLVVQLALHPTQIAVQRQLGARRQLRRHLRLRAPQDERTDAAREDLDRAAVLLRGRPAMPREGGRGAEQAGVQELEQAPQLAEMVLDRRAAQRQPVLRANQPRGLRRRRVRVLDRLRLVEDRVLELDVLQQQRVAPQRAVAGEDDVVAADAIDRAVRAAEVQHAELRREARGLFLPVEDDRPRHDDERRRGPPSSRAADRATRAP